MRMEETWIRMSKRLIAITAMTFMLLAVLCGAACAEEITEIPCGAGGFLSYMCMLPDGRVLELNRVAIDSAWGQSTKTVYRVCRDLQKTYGMRVVAARGRGITAAQKPFTEYRKEQGVKIGENWRFYKVRGEQATRIFEIDTNWWKSFLRQRILSPKGESGAWSIWGDDEEGHRMFAEHLSAEQSVTTSSEWRVVDIWTLIPGRENHLFDCAVGSMALASWCGASLNVGAEVLEDSKRRERSASPSAKPATTTPTIKRIVPLSAGRIVPH